MFDKLIIIIKIYFEFKQIQMYKTRLAVKYYFLRKYWKMRR